jgi:hypothetical protein
VVKVMSKTLVKAPAPRFKVGDRISFQFGVTPRVGVIDEDRGPIGVGGRRLYRIGLEVEPGIEMHFELPEEELSPSS